MAKSNKKATKSSKKTTTQKVSHARAYVTATFNNTLWGSAGASGFKGARKPTPYAATTTVEGVAKRAKERGVETIELHIKGPGPGRDAAIRAFKAAGLTITMIADVTPIPHNGPRASKRRRV